MHRILCCTFVDELVSFRGSLSRSGSHVRVRLRRMKKKKERKQGSDRVSQGLVITQSSLFLQGRNERQTAPGQKWGALHRRGALPRDSRLTIQEALKPKKQSIGESCAYKPRWRATPLPPPRPLVPSYLDTRLRTLSISFPRSGNVVDTLRLLQGS